MSASEDRQMLAKAEVLIEALPYFQLGDPDDVGSWRCGAG